jgi:hypothetical protein
MTFHVPNKFRMRDGRLGSDDSYGNNGAFLIPMTGGKLWTIAGESAGWEHVSVTRADQKIPSWNEMCRIKDMFWDEEDCVVQFHPPRSCYVNVHPGCLHLWRPVDGAMPLPPTMSV